MITRITKENAAAYRELFKKAEVILKSYEGEEHKPIVDTTNQDPILNKTVTYELAIDVTSDTFESNKYYELIDGKYEVATKYQDGGEYYTKSEEFEEITSLEQYFCYIHDLYQIDKTFTVLPFEDEENFFMIDANSRTIKVPDAFVKNGVSVQGDEIAEILYFKIDRFFDMDDLGEKQIYIEWRLPADKEGHRKEGVSAVYLQGEENISIAPGYVVFGWPISSKLTEIPGKIEFAVRFYQLDKDDDNKITYSLSTLPTSVEIKPTLNLDVTNATPDGSVLDLLQDDELIKNRIQNSTRVDESIPNPLAPEFFVLDKDDNRIFLFDDKIGVTVIEDEKKKTYYKLYLPYDSDYNPSTVQAQAYTTDTGVISYKWVKEYNNSLVPNFSGKTIYVLVGETEALNSDVQYYKEVTKEGTLAYEEITFTEATELKTADSKAKIYQRRTSLSFKASEESTKCLGEYKLIATNRKGLKSEKTYSPTLIVEGPDSIEIAKLAKTSFYFKDTTITDEGGNSVTQKQATVALGETTISPYAPDQTLMSYDLYAYDDKGNKVLKKSSNNPEFTIIGDDTEYNTDGYYSITAKAMLNGVVKSDDSEMVRVTHEATAPELSYKVGSTDIDDNVTNLPECPVGTALTVTISENENEKRVADDTYEYQWYKFNGSAEEYGNQTPNTDKDIILSDKTESTLTVKNTDGNEAGAYYCKVTNTYNSSKATTYSKFFKVYDVNYTEPSQAG